VAPATRERVRRAAEELGYRPNVVARGLQQRRSFALGLVVSDLRNPFSIDVISGAERVAAEEGYAVLLCDTRERTIESHLDALESRWIDGVILEPAAIATANVALRRNLVLINEPSAEHPAVLADMEAAGRMAAQHLIQLGHTRIGFIGPASDLFRYRNMERAFVRTLKASNIPIRADWFRRSAASVRGGEAAALELLALADRPTALMGANDLVAMGAIKACVARKVRVPDDMSVIGCDDVEMARLVQPELTTVSVPALELGARAARLLIRQLKGETRERSARALPVRLIARGTTSMVRA
jgi:DNA-binding LacI/PurR family transcriptional regulator